MDKRSLFLKWFNKHHKLCGDIYTVVSLASIYTLSFDAVHGSILRVILLVLWCGIFLIPGHVFFEDFLCAAAERLDSDNT